MATSLFKRGIHAEQIPSEPMPGRIGTQIPCYIGSSPYWQTDDPDWQAKAGKAFLITDFEDFKNQLGYTEPETGAWPLEYSLCEAAAAHFRWAINQVSPIICILNATPLEANETAVDASVIFKGGRAVLEADREIILSSLDITGKTRGSDYEAIYDDSGVTIVLVDHSGTLEGSVAIHYHTIHLPAYLAFAENTFDALETSDQTIQAHPCVLAAPGWEHETIGTTTVGKMLQTKAEGLINNHWFVQSYIQLDADGIDSAEAFKQDAGYDSHKVKAFWPYTMKDKRIYSLVTKTIVEKMKIDIQRGNVPFESASNKKVDCTSICNQDGSLLLLTDKQSDRLNAVGIATVKYAGGGWRTWGVCMANFDAANDENILPEQQNDVAVQMLDYVCNNFQEIFIDVIDKPINNRMARAIIDDYQVILNGYVATGALLYGNISFNEKSNPVQSLAKGDFVFDIRETSTPPGKSLTARVQYTVEGLNNIFPGGGA